jgi:hypothetical protein
MAKQVPFIHEIATEEKSNTLVPRDFSIFILQAGNYVKQ